MHLFQERKTEKGRCCWTIENGRDSRCDGSIVLSLIGGSSRAIHGCVRTCEIVRPVLWTLEEDVPARRHPTLARRISRRNFAVFLRLALFLRRITRWPVHTRRHDEI